MDHQTLQASFKCPKCSNTQCEMGELRAAGGFWTKFFNIQNKRFKSLSCTQCQYTELYKATTNAAENVLDFFGN